MRHIIRRLPSPAMVVAIIALAVALGGTGYAASQLNDNRQDTSLFQRLMRDARVASAAKARNATEARAAASPGTLASGKTEAGVWAVDGHASGARQLVGANAESFAFPLASAPKANYVTKSRTAACPGTAARPSATRGNLCVYLTGSKNVGTVTIYREIDNGKGAAPIGFSLVVTSRARGSVYAFGSWAVRAP